MKKLLFFAFTLLLTFQVSAQHKRLDPNKGIKKEKEKKSLRQLKSWQIDDRFGSADTLAIDTLMLNYQDNLPMYNMTLSSAWNGNLGSPMQSRLYFDRVSTGVDFYSAAFAPYLLMPKNVRIYNTHIPFSELAYRTSVARYHEEDYLRTLFTVNMTAHWNLGVQFNHIYARGQYTQQASDMQSGAFWVSYYGNKYEFSSIFTLNRYRNYLNGGIVDRDYILSPDKVDASDIDTENIPINLENTKAKYQNYSYFMNQKIHLGYWTEVAVEKDSLKEKNNNDSIASLNIPIDTIEYEDKYISAGALIHTINLQDVKRTFQEKSPLPSAFYQNTYYGDHRTLDLNRMWQLRNTIALALNQEINPLGFGAKAFVEHDFIHYSAATDTLRLNNHNENNVRIGGIIARQSKGWLQFSALFQSDILGEKAGDYMLKAVMASNFNFRNEPIYLEADMRLYQDTYLDYYSNLNTNHFKWSNNFDPKQAQQFGARISLPNRDISFGVRAENVNNIMYFGTDSLPHQSSDLVQVFAADAKIGLHFGVFNWENQLVYQHSTDAESMPLPELTLYSNMYYKSKWFKVLDAQIGVNCRYNTAYYGNLFVPATGAFVHQKNYLIGNYPVCNIYANFKVRTVRFFVQYNHANQRILDTRNYFVMSSHPLNPSTVQFGFSWSFYD